MRESSLVSTNVLNWPRVAGFLPELKFIWLALWSCPYLSCSGTGLVPLRPFAASLGFSPEALQNGLGVLEVAGLIFVDEQTGELFICDWYRFHTFKNAKSYGMLLNVIEKIESNSLRELVRSKIPTAPKYGNGAGDARPGQPRPSPRPNDDVDGQTGAILRTQEDRSQLDFIIKKHGVEIVDYEVKKIKKDGGRPFISNILSSLKSSNPMRSGLNREYDPENPRNQDGVVTIT